MFKGGTNVCHTPSYGTVFDLPSWLWKVGWFYKLLLGFLHYDSPCPIGQEPVCVLLIPKYGHFKYSFGNQGNKQQVSYGASWPTMSQSWSELHLLPDPLSTHSNRGVLWVPGYLSSDLVSNRPWKVSYFSFLQCIVIWVNGFGKDWGNHYLILLSWCLQGPFSWGPNFSSSQWDLF